MSLKFTTVPSKNLNASISTAATSFRLSDILGWDGVALTAANFGTQAYVVFRNAARTQIEIMEINAATIAASDITITRRGLMFDGTLLTEVTANKLPWTKGDTIVDLGSDPPQLWQFLKEYIDAAAIAGGVPATTTVLGITKMSVAPASASSPIAVGDNDPRVPTQAENDALVGDIGTPGTTNKYRLQNASMTAGATINGATTPVPIYQDTTTFKYLACISNDNTKIKYQGFAVSNSTDTNPINVQFDGVVAGFTGLTRGVKYYLTDASGIIGVTPGTIEIEVGIAVSTTQLLIAKGKRYQNGTTSFTATASTAIVTGFKPSKIHIHAYGASASASQNNSSSDGGWSVKGTNNCIYFDKNGSAISSSGIDTTNAWHVDVTNTNPDIHFGTVVTITENGFTLQNTKTGAPPTVQIFWEAEGEF